MAAAEISQAAMPLVVAGEVAVVIAEMRKNQRFQRRQDTQDPLIISLSELRRMVFQEVRHARRERRQRGVGAVR